MEIIDDNLLLKRFIIGDKVKYILSILLLISCSNVPQRVNPKYEKLDKYLDLVESYEKGMGSVTILKSGKIEYTRHFTSIEEPSSPVYRIGSITKTYTAVLILKLIEEGKLSLDTKLSKFYKNISNSKRITIEHLLKHRSGLPNMTSQSDYLKYFEDHVTENIQIDRFKKYKLEFKPGSKYAYSNTGYVLLSYIAEKVSSLSYQQLLEKYITSPLNLKKTFVYDKYNPRTSEVKSYEKGAVWEKSSNTHESVPTGAGAISSTPKEVAIFLRAIFKGELLSNNSLKEMRSLSDGYGLGITTFPYNTKKAFGHSGGIDGYRSIVGYIEEDDLVFTQLTNGMATSFNDISIAILASYYQKSFELPQYKRSIAVSDDILKKYSGTYSAKSFPLKLTFRSKNGVLLGLASGPGQSEIPFEATTNEDFSYMRAGIKLKFSDDGKNLDFTQGKTFKLKKE